MVFRIKEARKAANLTQKQLAEKLGIKVSTLSGYEIGAHDPKSNTLSQIAQICNTTVDYLLGITQHQEDEFIPDTPDPAISEIEFALSGEIHDLTESEMQDVLDYVRFKRAQRSQQEKKP